MHPAAGMASIRETTAPTKIGPYTVPKGTLIWPVIYGIQNSINNWDSPREFIPVRIFTLGAIGESRCRSAPPRPP